MQDRGQANARQPSVRRSLALSFAQKYTNLALTLPTIMIISRLLTPAQIGIFSVAMAFMSLVNMLRDFGVSQFVVQHPSADDAIVRSAFTVNLIIASTLGIGLFWASDYIGVFYGAPELARVLQVVSITFFLMPFGSTIRALLTRHMEFGALYKINTSASVVRTGCAIGLAAWGLGAISLAWASLASMAASVLACGFWGSDYRVRGLGLSQWRQVFRFGAIRASGDIAVQIGMRSSDLIIGRVLGMPAAGLYSRGYGLINMFRENVVAAVNAVAFPAFADHHRANKQSDTVFLQSLTLLTGVSWPFFLFAALMAFPIIRIMFGAQWDAAVVLLQWLAVAAMVGTLIFQCNYYLTAIGRVGLATRNEVVFQAIRVGVICVAVFQGLVYVAAAQVLVYALAVIIYYASLRHAAGISIQRVLAALRPSVLLTLITGAGPVLVYVFLTPTPDRLWLPLMLAGLSALLGWIAGSFVSNHPLWPELQRATDRLYMLGRQRLSAG